MTLRLVLVMLVLGSFPLHAAELVDPRLAMLASISGSALEEMSTGEIRGQEFAATPAQPLPDPQPRLLLHDAAINNIPAWANHLLDRGIDPEERDAQGHTALMVAAAFNSLEVAKILLARGADPLAVDKFRGDTALHYAARAGWPKIVDLLLSRGASIDHPSSKSGDTPLHYAALVGSAPVIRLLVAEGADVNAPNYLGVRPIQYAFKTGHKHAAMLLLDLGARADDLQDAVNAGDVARVQYFLGRKVDVNAMDLFGAPLHRASATGQTYIANMLIDVGADLEAIGEAAGNRSLHIAALNNQPQIAALLIARGAMIDVPNSEGRTPLMIAAQFGNLEVARILVAKGADPDKKDTIYQDSPIHVAVLGGNREMVELLLSHGANVNLISDHSGESPLVYAAVTGNAPMIELLVARGADRTQLDNLGRTANTILKCHTPPVVSTLLSLSPH